MVQVRAHVRMLDLDKRRARLVLDQHNDGPPVEVQVDESALAGLVFALAQREACTCQLDGGTVVSARVQRRAA